MNTQKRTVLSLAVIFLFFIYPISYVSSIPLEDLEIQGNPGDILVYQFDLANQTTYQKYNLTTIQPVEDGLNITYNVFLSSLTSNFTDEPQNTTHTLLTGNLTKDLFSETSFFNIFLPLSANFSMNEEYFEDYVAEVNAENRLSAEYSIGRSGLNCRITIYFYLVVYVKFLEMEVFYSSTRVLLRSRFWVKNPQGSESFEAILNILPDLSTPEGVDENPFDPLNITGATNSSSFDNELGEPTKNIKFDAKSIVIISGTGVVIIGGPILLFHYLMKKKKKKTPELNESS